MAEIDLNKLRDPFPAEDIEWRVSRAGTGRKGIFCCCLAYITARAIQQRLDDVCGPANWRNESLEIKELRPGVVAMVVGISIRIGDEWVTKWDVSEPTNIEAAKGGFSGGMKRAGAQWGIGRYLYHLTETFAETSSEGGRDWNWAKLKDGTEYYWKPPALPVWAVPKEPEHEIKQQELNELKRAWRDKFAPEEPNPSLLSDGFSRFVTSVAGEFPHSDYTCWTKENWQKCQQRIKETTDPQGVTPEIPFE